MRMMTALAFMALSFLGGAFFQFCVRYEELQEARKETRQAYAEADQLREVIYANEDAIRNLDFINKIS